MSHLIVRTEGGTHIGLGHIMRCLALSQEWITAGGSVSFILRGNSKALDQRLSDEKITSIYLNPAIPPYSDREAVFCADIAKKNGAGWVVIDGYQFGSAYQKKIKDAGLKTLAIDDNGLAGPHADIILNQNAYAKASLYKKISRKCRLLLGPEYVLIRKEFRESVPEKRAIPEHAKKILVTFGGGDSSNVTSLVLNGIDLMSPQDGLEIRVILGENNPHRAMIEGLITRSHHNIEVLMNVTNMAPLISWADVGISSGGSTNLEFAFLGLPGITIPFAQNQIMNCDTLHEIGITINLGWYESVKNEQVRDTLSTLCADYIQRQSMSTKGKMIVDGNGASRIVKILMEGSDA